MARIYQREKVWYLDYHVGTQRVRRKVGTSKKVAELALKEVEVKIAKEELGFARKEISVTELIERFIEYNKTNHRPSTVQRYSAVLAHFREYMELFYPGHSKVSRISTEQIEGYKSFRKHAEVTPNGHKNRRNAVEQETRKGARSKTINFELDCLKTMFNLAIRLGYLTKNPVVDVRQLKGDDKKPPRMLTVEESGKLLASADAELRPILVTLLHTGMRKGELEHLQWRDVDFERMKIHVRPKKGWNPKTSSREIPMSITLKEAMKQHRKQSAKLEPNDFVFEILDGTHSHNWIRTQLIKLARAVGIPNLTTVHALRHTFASHLVMQGVDLPTVSKLLGHTDIQTTMIYSHLAGDHLAKAVEKLPFK